jgi:hypothetical protein
LPLQSNSGRHPTPLFWYLGFHGNFILNFEVVLVRVDFFKMAAVAMETAKMLKN